MALDELQDQKSLGAHWSRLEEPYGDVRWKKNIARFSPRRVVYAWMISRVLKQPFRNQQTKSTVWVLEEQNTEGGTPIISGKYFRHTMDSLAAKVLHSTFKFVDKIYQIPKTYIYKWFLEGVYLNKIYKNSSAQSMLCKEKKTYAPSR